jgi:hypothetical protein
MLGKITPSQRLKTGLALGLVFLLVFATNQVDRKHFETVQFNLQSIFEDRLVAKGYLYQLQDKLFKEQLSLEDSTTQYLDADSSFSQILEKYKGTKLTTAEQNALQTFQEQIAKYRSLKKESPNPQAWANQLIALLKTLDQLAEIQIKEGEVLNRTAKKSLDFTDFISQLEIIVLVLTGLIIQVLIFYRPKKR